MGEKKVEQGRHGGLLAVQYGHCRECGKQIRRQKQLNATTAEAAAAELDRWEPDFIHDRCWAINRAFAQIMAEDMLAGRANPFYTPGSQQATAIPHRAAHGQEAEARTPHL